MLKNKMNKSLVGIWWD